MGKTEIRETVDNRKTNLQNALYVLPRNRFLHVLMNDFLARITFSCSFRRALLTPKCPKPIFEVLAGNYS